MSLSLTELKEKTPTELAEVARSLKLDHVSRLRKQDQIFAILKSQAKRGEKIKGEGVVEILQDGFGFYVLPAVHTWRDRMISMFHQVRFGASVCVLATQSAD